MVRLASTPHGPSLITVSVRSFADIFANNCIKNGLLPVTITVEEMAKLMHRAKSIEGYQLTVDLKKRHVSDPQGLFTSFEIDDFQRHCLLEGLDDIGLTLKHETQIDRYEMKRPAWIAHVKSAEQNA